MDWNVIIDYNTLVPVHKLQIWPKLSNSPIIAHIIAKILVQWTVVVIIIS